MHVDSRGGGTAWGHEMENALKPSCSSRRCAAFSRREKNPTHLYSKAITFHKPCSHSVWLRGSHSITPKQQMKNVLMLTRDWSALIVQLNDGKSYRNGCKDPSSTSFLQIFMTFSRSVSKMCRFWATWIFKAWRCWVFGSFHSIINFTMKAHFWQLKKQK